MGCQSAFSQPANEPLADFITTDGAVYALAETNNVLYLGGAFRSVGLRTGGGVPVDITTGEAEPVYPKFNGTVQVAISDGAGGWFVGGAFTLVGESVRSNIVHIRSDRSVNPAWSPAIGGGSVQTLWLTNGTLYVGGSFTNVNGQTRNRLTALDAVSGSLLAWNPDANGAVNALAVYGTNVYLGGEFSNVGGQTRNRIAAVNHTTGALATWNPGASGSTSASVNAFEISGGRLFVGGYFSSIGGQSRGNAASFDLATGNLEAWNPGIGTATIVAPTVFAMAADGDTVYVGGVFSRVGAITRVNIAAVDAVTGLATSWDAHAGLLLSSGLPTSSIWGITVWSNTVYVGGSLGEIGGQSRSYAAALDPTTGDALPWNPDPNVNVLTLSGSGNSLFMGGVFSALGSVPRTNLAAFDLTTKQVTPWNPAALGNVWALQIVNDQMYIGGEFTNINGVARARLASVDLTTGALSDWNPNPNSFVVALARWQDRLYVAGGFTNIAGVYRTNLAEFDLTTGTPTAWDAGINRAQVRALAVSGDTLYAGGLITTAQGQARQRIAAFDLTTGLLTPWNPGISTSGAANVEAIEPVGDVVYIGGRFSTVAGQNRTNFVAVDAETAAVLPMSAHTDQPVTGLAATTNQVFIGGNFSVVNGQERAYLASLSVATGQLTAWNPGADFYDQRIYMIKDVLYPVGVFLRVGGQTSRGIAAFPLTAAEPGFVANSTRSLPDGSFQFQVYAPGAAQVTVLGSTNLSTWEPIQNLNLVGGHGTYTDVNVPNHPQRYFRLMLP